MQTTIQTTAMKASLAVIEYYEELHERAMEQKMLNAETELAVQEYEDDLWDDFEDVLWDYDDDYINESYRSIFGLWEYMENSWV